MGNTVDKLVREIRGSILTNLVGHLAQCKCSLHLCGEVTFISIGVTQPRRGFSVIAGAHICVPPTLSG